MRILQNNIFSLAILNSRVICRILIYNLSAVIFNIELIDRDECAQYFLSNFLRKNKRMRSMLETQIRERRVAQRKNTHLFPGRR